jgi:[ribosomal protein S5]-alanine N-acetyltransferase
VLELQRLRLDHESAVLDFELANRAYFARSINDRGDAYYAEFAQQHRTALAEQEAGEAAFHVLVDEDGEVVGRFNLYEVANGTAVVGYRIAERVSGQGVATAALRDLVRIAGAQYGLRRLRAITSTENVASQRVLVKAGFDPVGVAEVVGHPGVMYEIDLAGTREPSERISTRLDDTAPLADG